MEALGSAARTTPPGTEAIGRVFALAEAPVLVLFDEVLNFVNRHRGMADSFHAFIQNLTVAVTGTTRAAAVISLPRSQVEMTDWDQQWQERITKVVRRVAQDLIANDEAEIGEVVRRRLFEDLGSARTRNRIAKSYADWCFERSNRLPPHWTAVDTATTEARAKDALRSRFSACYPIHPATLSVFQRKWRALPQFQQTRGALAMLAQWVSWASRTHFKEARTEQLITLGSAPLHDSGFRSTILGQLGESRLDPELRFALGEPDVETTTVDNAAAALAGSSFFIRKVGTDGFKIHHVATLRKVVSDRRASLDVRTKAKSAEEEAKDEVWAGYRFVALGDAKVASGLRVIDLGAGHASASETLSGRIVGALKSEAILNESVGAGYIARHWPPALKEAGAWPLTGLRQSFLDGSLTRLIDPDAVLRRKIVEFVGSGAFGLASGSGTGGRYERLWYNEIVAPEDVVFETGMFLLTRTKAEELRSPEVGPAQPEPELGPPLVLTPEPGSSSETQPVSREVRLRIVGTVPPETWNRIGIKVLPKMRSGNDLTAHIELSVNVSSRRARNMENELRQILNEMGLGGSVRLERS